MAHFISCGANWINLDHVARAEESTQDDGRPVLVFKNADDKVIGRSYDVDDFWEYAAPVLPASAGAVALVVTTHCGTEGFHGRPGEVWLLVSPLWDGVSDMAARYLCCPKRARITSGCSSKLQTECLCRQTTFCWRAAKLSRRTASRKHKPPGIAATPMAPSVASNERH